MSLWRASSIKESIVLFLVYGAILLFVIVAINYLFELNQIENFIITNIGILLISYKFLYPITRGDFRAQTPRDTD